MVSRITPPEYKDFAQSEDRCEQEQAFLAVLLSNSMPMETACRFSNHMAVLSDLEDVYPLTFIESIATDRLKRLVIHCGVQPKFRTIHKIRTIAKSFYLRNDLTDITPIELRSIPHVSKGVISAFSVIFTEREFGKVDEYILHFLRNTADMGWLPEELPSDDLKLLSALHTTWIEDVVKELPSVPVEYADSIMWSIAKQRYDDDRRVFG